MKHIVFVLFLFIPAFAFSQFGLGFPNRGLTELGKQTSARGLTYLGSGMPNTVIKWRTSKDTACYTWIDTLTSLEYKWNHTGDYWATQGIISKSTPPLATQSSGPATVDNREALWRSSANNVIHGYDRTQSAWIPLHVLRLSAAPSNISSSGSQGAAIYTGGLWKSTVDDSMRHYIAGAWRVISGGGSTYTAGSGISITGTTIANTGDLSSTNELNTGFDISGGNLRITDAGATRTVPITSIAPDQSATNEIQAIDTLRVNGANLELSLSQDGQPAKTLAVSSIAPVQAVSAGTGISISGTTTRTITNSAPDQTVSITGAGSATVSGTYPNFTVTGNGITALTGDVTASGPGSAAATIAANAVTSAKLAAGAVSDSLKIAVGAVTTTRIADGSVFAVDLATNAVTATKLAAGAVSDSSKIAANAVRTTDIADGQVWANDIANGAVTMAKINQAGATSGQVIAWNGLAWAPAAAGSGITSLGGQIGATQTFATGTSGSDFGISSAINTHTFNLPIANATNTGKLSSTDWISFNSKIGGSGASGQIGYWSASGTQSGDNRLSYSLGTGSSSATYIRVGGQGTLTNGGGLILNGTPPGSAFLSNSRAIAENETGFVGVPNANLAAFAFQFFSGELWFRRWAAGSTAHVDVARFIGSDFVIGATSVNARLNVVGASATSANNALLVQNSTPSDLLTIRNDGKVSYWATNTASGTTGAQTINRPSGTVNFAAGATSLVVTNNLVTTASIVFAVVRTADATAVIKNVVPASGSFTINLNAAATAETSVGFFVIN